MSNQKESYSNDDNADSNDVVESKKIARAARAAMVSSLKPDFSELVSVVKELKEFLVQSRLEDELETSKEKSAEHSGVEMSLHPLQEMDALINLRGFVTLMINNYNRSKTEIADIISMSTLIDNKIVSMLLSSEFKEYVHFNEAKAAIAKAREYNDIKSTLKIG